MPQTDRTKCLLVDDVEENLIALEALLQRDGLDILKAQSGPEALELLLAHDDVALALLDVQMPEMNGFELAELIRGSERTRHIPLIFMTAGSREQNWQFRGTRAVRWTFCTNPSTRTCSPTKRACSLNCTGASRHWRTSCARAPRRCASTKCSWPC